MSQHVLLTASPLGVAAKGLSLDALPEAAWTPIIGGVGSADLLDLYEQIPWLYRAVTLRADALASLPLRWSSIDGEPLDAPPLPFALDLPHLLNLIEGWLVLYGAAYLLKETNAAGRIKALRPLHPASVSPQIDPLHGIIGYERRAGGERFMLEAEEVVAVHLPNRRAEIGPGTPPARAALAAAGMLRAADHFSSQYFQSGAMMPTLISVEGMPPPAEMEKLQSWIDRSLNGVRNAFRSLVLRGGVKVEPLGSPVELGALALPELTDKKREDIATALGVPHSLLFSSAANYATARQDDLHFYDKTVLPQARWVEAALNAQLFTALGLRLRFAAEQLELYQELEAQKAEKVVALLAADLISRDEARAMIALGP